MEENNDYITNIDITKRIRFSGYYYYITNLTYNKKENFMDIVAIHESFSIKGLTRYIRREDGDVVVLQLSWKSGDFLFDNVNLEVFNLENISVFNKSDVLVYRNANSSYIELSISLDSSMFSDKLVYCVLTANNSNEEVQSKPIYINHEYFAGEWCKITENLKYSIKEWTIQFL